MRFESKEELGCYLYDRAVEPGDTTAKRLRLAVMASRAAEVLWAKYANGGDE